MLTPTVTSIPHRGASPYAPPVTPPSAFGPGFGVTPTYVQFNGKWFRGGLPVRRPEVNA